jgi:hypothetical protein
MDLGITRVFLGLSEGSLPPRHSRELSTFGQQDAFFQLAALKSQRLHRLRQTFGGQPPHRLVLGPRIVDLDPRPPGWTVDRLAPGFFDVAPGPELDARCAQLADAVVVVNNNDLGRGDGPPAYCDFYARCERTVFIGWDWDNHHWLDRSAMLAAHCDLYAPAHHENLYLMTRYNPCTVGPVYCGTVQWASRTLSEQLPRLIEQPRSDQPLGMHIPYGSFVHRNRIVNTLNRHFTTVGFSDPSFHERSAQERLLEWSGHKAHWIVPVLNDVPIRLFDALATGGIPLVPASLQHLAPARDIPQAHIVFYGPHDVIDPQTVVARANALFDEAGADGIVARHRLALEQHHGNVRIQQMLTAAARQFGWTERAR